MLQIKTIMTSTQLASATSLDSADWNSVHFSTLLATFKAWSPLKKIFEACEPEDQKVLIDLTVDLIRKLQKKLSFLDIRKFVKKELPEILAAYTPEVQITLLELAHQNAYKYPWHIPETLRKKLESAQKISHKPEHLPDLLKMQSIYEPGSRQCAINYANLPALLGPAESPEFPLRLKLLLNVPKIKDAWNSKIWPPTPETVRRFWKFAEFVREQTDLGNQISDQTGGQCWQMSFIPLAENGDASTFDNILKHLRRLSEAGLCVNGIASDFSPQLICRHSDLALQDEYFKVLEEFLIFQQQSESSNPFMRNEIQSGHIINVISCSKHVDMITPEKLKELLIILQPLINFLSEESTDPFLRNCKQFGLRELMNNAISVESPDKYIPALLTTLYSFNNTPRPEVSTTNALSKGLANISELGLFEYADELLYSCQRIARKKFIVPAFIDSAVKLVFEEARPLSVPSENRREFIREKLTGLQHFFEILGTMNFKAELGYFDSIRSSARASLDFYSGGQEYSVEIQKEEGYTIPANPPSNFYDYFEVTKPQLIIVIPKNT